MITEYTRKDIEINLEGYLFNGGTSYTENKRVSRKYVTSNWEKTLYTIDNITYIHKKTYTIILRACPICGEYFEEYKVINIGTKDEEKYRTNKAIYNDFLDCGYCRECQNIRQRAWSSENKEKIQKYIVKGSYVYVIKDKKRNIFIYVGETETYFRRTKTHCSDIMTNGVSKFADWRIANNRDLSEFETFVLKLDDYTDASNTFNKTQIRKNIEYCLNEFYKKKNVENNMLTNVNKPSNYEEKKTLEIIKDITQNYKIQFECFGEMNTFKDTYTVNGDKKIV